MKISEQSIGLSVVVAALCVAVGSMLHTRLPAHQPPAVAQQEATEGAASQQLAEELPVVEEKTYEVAKTAPLAPNGHPYPYRWAPPGPRPTTLFYNYTWMPDAQGADRQGWWLMPNGQPAVQYAPPASACGPDGCPPTRFRVFGRR